MARTLKGLMGRSLTFIDENNDETNGTLMYLEFPFSLEGPSIDYFFVPYDKTHLFRVSFIGQNKSYISKDHKKIYGLSDSYLDAANNDELKALAQFEGLFRMCDPAAEIRGRQKPLIKVPDLSEKTKVFTGFPVGFSIGV